MTSISSPKKVLGQNLRFSDRVEDVFGPDPGLIRLRSAWRTTISGAVTLATPYFLSAGDKKSGFMVMSLAFMAAMVANTAVTDPTRMRQTVTIAFMEIPAIAAVALSALLRPWAPADGIVFVLVTGLSVWMRKLGPRASALGAIAFFSYFEGEIVHPPLTLLPQLAAGVAIALATTVLLKFVVLRDRPEKVLGRLQAHIVRHLRRILVLSKDRLSPEGRQDSRSDDRLHAEIAKLADAQLLAQAQIEKLLPPGERQATLREILFDVYLAAEEVIRESGDVTEPNVRAAGREHIESLLAVLDSRQPAPKPPAQPDEPLLADLGRLQGTIRALFERLQANTGPLERGSWREGVR